MQIDTLAIWDYKIIAMSVIWINAKRMLFTVISYETIPKSSATLCIFFP